MLRRIPAARALMPALIAFAVPAAFAAEHDAVHACPGLASHLQDQLGYVVAKVEERGRMHVRFQARDDRAVKVQLSGQPSSYEGRLRSALAVLRCEGLRSGDVYAFDVEFLVP